MADLVGFLGLLKSAVERLLQGEERRKKERATIRRKLLKASRATRIIVVDIKAGTVVSLKKQRAVADLWQAAYIAISEKKTNRS